MYVTGLANKVDSEALVQLKVKNQSAFEFSLLSLMSEGNGVPPWSSVWDWDGDESTSTSLFLLLSSGCGPGCLLVTSSSWCLFGWCRSLVNPSSEVPCTSTTGSLFSRSSAKSSTSTAASSIFIGRCRCLRGTISIVSWSTILLSSWSTISIICGSTIFLSWSTIRIICGCTTSIFIIVSTRSLVSGGSTISIVSGSTISIVSGSTISIISWGIITISSNFFLSSSPSCLEPTTSTSVLLTSITSSAMVLKRSASMATSSTTMETVSSRKGKESEKD